MKFCPSRKLQEIDAFGRDVFAEFSGADIEAEIAELIEQLRLYEVDLPVVRNVSVLSCEVAMLDKGSGMRIPFDAMSFDETHAPQVSFTEAMRCVGADRDNDTHARDRHAVHRSKLVAPTSRYQRLDPMIMQT